MLEIGAAARRILVVDDNRDLADSLAMLLESMGNHLRTAHDGAEAVKIASEFRPHAVALDVGLPKMNGFDVARALRQQPWGEKIVLVAVTGWGQERDRQRAIEAGFDHHMVKPVDAASLLRLIDGSAHPGSTLR